MWRVVLLNISRCGNISSNALLLLYCNVRVVLRIDYSPFSNVLTNNGWGAVWSGNLSSNNLFLFDSPIEFSAGIIVF